MSFFIRIVPLAWLCLQGIQSYAQTYPFARLAGNPIDTTGWFLAGDAKAEDTEGDTNALADELVLCPPQNFRSGAAYFRKPVNITSCQKWTAEFDFRIWEGTGADGLSFFFLNNPPESYIRGGGMGIPPRPMGLMVCFDTWQNCNANTSGRIPKIQIRSGNGISNYSECPTPAQPTTTEVRSIRRPEYNHAKIVYDFGTVSVFLNDTLRLTGNYNINFAGYFGLTASTGGSTDRHSVRDFVLYTFKPLLVAPEAGPDRTLCNGAQTVIGTPEVGTGYTYKWFPATGLSDSSISNPHLSLQNSNSEPLVIKYFVTKDTVGVSEPRCAFADEVKITMLPRLNQNREDVVACGSTATPIGFEPVQNTEYLWTPSTFLESPLGSDPIFLSQSPDTSDRVFTFQVTASHPAGCTETDSVRVRRLGRFARAGSDKNVCGSDTLILGESVPSGINFSWFLLTPASPRYQSWIENAQGGQTRVGLSIRDSVPVTLRYRLIALRQDFNCRNDDTVQVRLFPVPRKRSLGRASVCPAEVVTVGLPSLPGFQYAWLNRQGVSDTTQAQPQLTGLPVSASKDTLYRVRRFWSDLPACASIDSLFIRWKQNPVLANFPDQKICPGGSVSLVENFTQDPLTQYLWEPGLFLGSDTVVSTTVSLPDQVQDTVLTYSVSANREGCEVKDSVGVRVHPSVPFTANDTVALCSGIEKVLGPEPVPGHSYLWLSTTGISDPTLGQPILTLTFSNSLAGSLLPYPVRTQTDSTGCFRMDTLEVQLLSSPTPFAGSDSLVCSGDTLLLGQNIQAVGHQFQWSGASGILDPNRPDSRFSTSALSLETQVAVLTETNLNGCIGRDTVEIQVRPLPVPVISSGRERVCASDSVYRYQTSGQSGSTWTWDVTGQVAGSGTDWIDVRWGSESGQIRLRETDSFGCSAWGNPLLVSALPRPAGQLTGPEFLCPGSFDKEYRLEGPDRIGRVFGTSVSLSFQPGSDRFLARFDSLNTNWRVGIQLLSEEGCFGDSLFLNPVLDRVVPELLSASVFAPGKLEIKAKPFSDLYQARIRVAGFEDLVLGTDGITESPQLPTSQVLEVYQEVQDQCGIFRNSSIHKTISGSAEETIFADRLEVRCRWTEYAGVPAVLTHTLHRFDPASDDFVPVPGGQAGNQALTRFPTSDPPRFKVKAIWEREGIRMESWSDEFGVMPKKPEPEFPTLITPNGDGRNETWEVSYLNWYPGAELKIFNRWGKEVFHTIDYRNDWKPESSEEGLYYFELIASGGNWKGWISVVR